VAKRDPEGLDKVDVPQGTLELMILTILAREPLHGYGISQRLTALSRDHFRVNPGSLFPTLYRLEQDGKLEAEWRPSENNRNAKYYALTAAGRRQLAEHKRRWERVSFAINSVLEGA
jgi:transcriptional regulator